VADCKAFAGRDFVDCTQRLLRRTARDAPVIAGGRPVRGLPAGYRQPCNAKSDWVCQRYVVLGPRQLVDYRTDMRVAVSLGLSVLSAGDQFLLGVERPAIDRADDRRRRGELDLRAQRVIALYQMHCTVCGGIVPAVARD